MNAQSNSIERYFVKSGIPYRIVGGLRFYERKEIKDVIAYLSVVNNPSDAVRLSRIVNEPKRGIGAATIDKAKEVAAVLGKSVFEILETASEYADLSSRASKLKVFTDMIRELQEAAEEKPLDELFDFVLEMCIRDRDKICH